MKTTKTIVNVGTVAVKELELCGSSIGLYIPITEMSDEIKQHHDEFVKIYFEKFSERYPNVDTSSLKLDCDIALHMFLDSESRINSVEKSVRYAISEIIGLEELKETTQNFVESFDLYDIDINAEDSTYLKKLVIKKLVDVFF
ncbi:MAG: hypothetical protein PHW34_07685 [Hespellia sp.]|nr:hypothetical protein [Hespellia sp.]